MQRNPEKTRLYNALYIAIIVIIGIVCLVLGYNGNDEKAISEFETSTPEQTEEYIQEITIYITGEVFSPGLYTVQKGIRVMDVIELAGGATENADLEGVNLAKIISDGDQIKVPTKKKTTSSSSSAKTKQPTKATAKSQSNNTTQTTKTSSSEQSSSPKLSSSTKAEESIPSVDSVPLPSDSAKQSESGKININCGDTSKYMLIDGITPQIAESLVSYVAQYGGFQSIEELQFVPGITKKIYDKIKDSFTI